MYYINISTYICLTISGGGPTQASHPPTCWTYPVGASTSSPSGPGSRETWIKEGKKKKNDEDDEEDVCLD